MKKKESEFEKLARIFKEEIDDAKNELREDLGEKIDSVKSELSLKMDKGFYGVNQRLDVTIQPQLDGHARRIKKLETEVLPRS